MIVGLIVAAFLVGVTLKGRRDFRNIRDEVWADQTVAWLRSMRRDNDRPTPTGRPS